MELLIRKEFTAGFIATLHQTHAQALSFHKYSPASDIWSYGVLLYEIWSIGQKPFVRKTNGQVNGSTSPNKLRITVPLTFFF